MNKENDKPNKLQNEQQSENCSAPNYVAEKPKSKSSSIVHILIWAIWLILFNLIVVILSIDITSYGPIGSAIAAFLYMAIFWNIGRYLCSLWDRFKQRKH
ncbi:hypothetical protein [Enterocloster asparagiformis]|uniref:hypothetical protein n=1 Tax=Enterocloster asparagiformis TaxID=333367 RepID=UPI0011CA2748|nr:hypothetical protein [Enterocloster asparagiformis]